MSLPDHCRGVSRLLLGMSIVFTASSAQVGCGGDDFVNAPPMDTDSGWEGSAGQGGGGVGGGGGASLDATPEGTSGPDAPSEEAGITCEADEKVCANACVSKTKPVYGCASADCKACAVPHSVAQCLSTGACGIGTCDTGWDDCDKQPANGCEADLATDVGNCGKCGVSCSFPNATPTCVSGQCQLGTCKAGYANCDNDTKNGCESNSQTDDKNCGKCGTACQQAGSTQTCEAGKCVLSNCDSGLADCDGNASNGCEVDKTTDIHNCGGCTNDCTKAHSTPKCENSLCGIASCEADYADCNSDWTDGCEVHLPDDVLHCGSCTTPCNLPNAAQQCVSGACTIASCNQGFGNCDNNPATGCEANFATDPAHCNGCGLQCLVANGVPACNGGNCTVGSCNTWYGDCVGGYADGCETVLETDTSNCGKCGHVCDTTHATAGCASGLCSVSCNPDWGDCNTNVDDGCETSTATDVSNCGKCGTVCALPNTATHDCAAGICHAITCQTGWGDCEGDDTNGCEANLNEPAHCGSCAACNLSNATAKCSAGACEIDSCNSGFGNCDSSHSTGCEVNLTNDPLNCGSCGKDCLGGACKAGICQSIIIVTGQDKPHSIAVDATNIYWLNRTGTAANSQVRKASLAGASVVTLQQCTNGDGLALSSDRVFWADQGTNTIRSVLKADGTGLRTLNSVTATPADVAIYGSYVYWSNWGGGEIRRALLTATGNSSNQLVGGLSNPHRIAVNGADVFFTDFWTGNVSRVAITGGGAQVIGSGAANPVGVAIDANYVFWTAQGAGQVWRTSHTGAGTIQIALGASSATGIIVDTNYVYWTENVSPNGRLMRAPLTGGAATELATGLANPEYIAQDSSALYWTNLSEGTIRKIAK